MQYTKAGALKAGKGSIMYTTGKTTPEPATLSLLGLGAMGLMARRHKANRLQPGLFDSKQMNR